MTTPSSDLGFSILVVDDERKVLRLLADLIKVAVPRVKVHKAETVAAAMRLIRWNRERRRPYDLAILDFYLPADRGLQPEVDTTICAALRTDGVPVIHYTAWPEDEKIKVHMRLEHFEQDLGGAPVRLIERNTPAEWAEKVVKLIERYHQWVVSAWVWQQMGAVFGAELASKKGESMVRGREYTSMGRSVCGTHALMRLQGSIVENWDVLEGDLKAAIKKTFAVVELDTEDKRLSLFPDENGGER